MTSDAVRNRDEAVAVIGLACRFPKAGDVDAYWRLLRGAEDAIARYTREEALQKGAPPHLLDHPDHVNAWGLLDDADCFDAGFFNISPREALAMDPQHRLFLECAWTAIENAGYAPDQFTAPVGVFAGATTSTYHLNCLQKNAAWSAGDAASDALYGNFQGFLSTRLSYKLNLKGPSVSIQTACSTSLVAVHMARESLLNFDCDLALAGGVSLRFPQYGGYDYVPDGIQSPDGRCRAFDKKAGGTVFGDGVGVVILKRLADAIADGDHIDAVIIGSAINNDGAQKAGFTAPSVQGQAEVIRAAQLSADVSPDEIGYIEAHGTGTQIGDPIEVRALASAFSHGKAPSGRCAIGSVKAHLGHLDAAAGVASFIKAVLVAREGYIPPTPHFSEPNPELRLDDTPFRIAGGDAWDAPIAERFAGVSSFGFGGTNAHVVLQGWAEPPREQARRDHFIIAPVSGRKKEQAQTLAQEAAQAMRARPEAAADIAHTLQSGRSAFSWRAAIVAPTNLAGDDSSDASERIKPFNAEQADRPAVFLFSGQGAQYPGMSAALYQSDAVFKSDIDLCADILNSTLDADIREILYSAGVETDVAQRLTRTEFAQPALFAVEFAIANWWRRRGVRPAAMIGHSIGEYAAAHFAGVFSLEAALRLVAERGRLMQSMPKGAMLSVPLSAPRAEEFAPPGVELAAVNADELSVFAGPDEAIAEFESRLRQKDVAAKRLRTSHAFHSAAMEGALTPFRRVLEEVELQPPAIPVACNLTGDWAGSEMAKADYWVAQLRNTVRFSDAVKTTLAAHDPAFIEIGPGAALASLAAAHLPPHQRARAIPSMRKANDRTADAAVLARAAAAFWTTGGSIDWREFHANGGRKTAAPTYPFERKRYYVAPDAPNGTTASLAKRSDITQWTYTEIWARAPEAIASDSSPAHWLIFADARGVGEALARQLHKAHAENRVSIVRPGSQFERASRDEYSVHPFSRDDFLSLLREIDDSPKRPLQIAFLWSLDASESSTFTEELKDTPGTVARPEALFSFAGLSSALAAMGENSAVCVCVATSGAYQVTGGDLSSPLSRATSPIARALPLECPTVRTLAVDLDPSASATEQAAQLLSACQSPPDGQAPLAARGAYLWRASVAPTPIRVDNPANNEQAASSSEGEHVFITGGFGGVGRAVAGHLARKGARISLMSRNADPDANKNAAETIRELEASGARVRAIAGDCADSEDMRRALGEATAAFGRIDGVIHAAGAAGGGVLALQTRETLWAACRAKFIGAKLATELLADQRPEFIYYFSSLAGLVAAPGRSDYAAANSLLDALAEQYFSQGRTEVMSIAWDLWEGVGMAAGSASAREARNAAITPGDGMRVNEALAIFDRARTIRTSVLYVSTRDLETIISEGAFRNDGDADQAIGLSNADTAARNADRTGLSAEYAAPETELERALATLWAEVIGVEEIGVDDDYFELGGDSLLALRLASRIQKATGAKIGPGGILEARTIAALARTIGDEDSKEKRLRAQIDKMSPEEIRRLLDQERAKSSPASRDH